MQVLLIGLQIVQNQVVEIRLVHVVASFYVSHGLASQLQLVFAASPLFQTKQVGY